MNGWNIFFVFFVADGCKDSFKGINLFYLEAMCWSGSRVCFHVQNLFARELQSYINHSVGISNIETESLLTLLMVQNQFDLAFIIFFRKNKCFHFEQIFLKAIQFRLTGMLYEQNCGSWCDTGHSYKCKMVMYNFLSWNKMLFNVFCVYFLPWCSEFECRQAYFLSLSLPPSLSPCLSASLAASVKHTVAS